VDSLATGMDGDSMNLDLQFLSRRADGVRKFFAASRKGRNRESLSGQFLDEHVH